MFDICISETPSIEALIEMRAASRVHAKDATLYDFDLEAEKCASSFMGWTDLASNPPYSIAEIIAFAAQARSGGIRDVILIAEGGSSQAAMALFYIATGVATIAVLAWVASSLLIAYKES